MNMNIEQQMLLLNGRKYTADSLYLLKSEAGENGSSPLSDVCDFLERWFDKSAWITVHTSGSTGVPKELVVRKEQMMQSARMTCEYLNLKPGDTALLCMNLRYIGAMMMVVRALIAGMNLIVRPACGHPLAEVEQPVRFAAMVPLQVYNTLQVREERERLKRMGTLLIGGGAIDETLEAEIRNLPGAVYSTYGMTETLSHIALRPLNGSSASDHYHPFSSVKLSLSPEKTLVVNAPLICDEVLQTNDVAHIYPDGSFIILGRKDNIINSGGIKIQPEAIEAQLRPLISVPFVITSIPDKRLGQAVVLLLACRTPNAALQNKIRNILPAYHYPKHILQVAAIPQTGNHKIDRVACRKLAEGLFIASNNR